MSQLFGRPIAVMVMLATILSGCTGTRPSSPSAEAAPSLTIQAATATPCNILEQIALPTIEGSFEQCKPEADPNHLTVTVSILPQEYFVRRIAGDHVQVNVMVPPGASPATYEPTPGQLSALSQSKVYFAIGVPFETSWMTRIQAANDQMTVVNTSDCIDRISSAEEGGNPDPHIWLSPTLVKQQAQTIYETLSRLDCTHGLEYQANLSAFLSDIDALDTRIRQQLEGDANRKFLVFHPSWGYFARDYGLEMIPIEVGGQEPSAAELANVIRQAKDNDIKVVFAQPEFSTRSAQTIADEIGAEVLLINPLSQDWLHSMDQAADAFAQALSR